mmetsp:Transcript_49186/g.117274  ORF Transcript_49186/g.117274 Transcript_49186/m.117274 type:complete len:210 (-) Transcript_49186:183-812(-)
MFVFGNNGAIVLLLLAERLRPELLLCCHDGSRQAGLELSGKHDFAVPDLVGQEAYSPCIAIIFSIFVTKQLRSTSSCALDFPGCLAVTVDLCHNSEVEDVEAVISLVPAQLFGRERRLRCKVCLLKELSIDFLKRLPLVFIGPPFPDGFLHHRNCFTTCSSHCPRLLAFRIGLHHFREVELVLRLILFVERKICRHNLALCADGGVEML